MNSKCLTCLIAKFCSSVSVSQRVGFSKSRLCFKAVSGIKQTMCRPIRCHICEQQFDGSETPTCPVAGVRGVRLRLILLDLRCDCTGGRTDWFIEMNA